MSNNIYDILKKINKLEGKVQTLKESKSMDKKEDKKDESKKKDKVKEGAIAEAIKRVEESLTEKYMGFKKTVAAIKKGGSAENPEAVAASIGRKKYGKEKFQKAAAAGKKLGEVVTLKPGAKERLEKEKQGKADAAAALATKMSGPPTVSLKKQPMGEGDVAEDSLTPKQQKFAKLAPPPDKITYADKIAGAKKSKMKDEGNEFSGALAQAKAQNKKEFSVDGKTYPVKEGFPSKEDAEKRMKEKEGKTAHGKKTATKTGVKHERDYDKHDSEKDTGDEKKGRGRPKKDKFAK